MPIADLTLTLSPRELVVRTVKEIQKDDVLGMAAQLAYYFFLGLFPALLCLAALSSFFPVANLTDELLRWLGPVAPASVLDILTAELQRLSNARDGGLLTLGVLGALWSSSAGVVAIISTMNRAYDVVEARPWWRVRLTAIALTVALAVFILLSMALLISGSQLMLALGDTVGLDRTFLQAWRVVRMPLALLCVATAIALVYYFGPDVEQDFVWITPGSIVAAALWLMVSWGLSLYVGTITDYAATYGTIGGVIVLMLWFYLSGLAILVGAELNAEIEHAAPQGKDPGEKVPGARRVIGARARRAAPEAVGHDTTPAHRLTH